ncbi:MAG: HAMP domain-containing histidine kinase [Deltaproteobacteria bacterium]|nr:HAMP domain-containing histidine kinase [Deltaproteobacteria bacterium]
MPEVISGQDKRYTVVLLRWVLIIASAYLLLFGPSGPDVDLGRALFVALVLGSNVVLNHLPQRWWESRAFDMALVLFDTSWVTVSLAWSPQLSDDFFMLYFLVLFVAALGESLPMIVGTAGVITALYGWGLSHATGVNALTSEAFLRMLFLFVVALFYGYFVTALRGRRREAAEARALEQAKTELLASISHDLRGPLSNAENYALLLLEGDCGALSDKQRDFTARLHANLRRVTSLVTNCLDASRIEAGRLRLQRTPLQFNEVVSDTLQVEGTQAAAKGISIERDIDPTLPPITGDMMHLGRVVANLLGNAVKYTPKGGHVRVRTRIADHGVCLDITDSGPGIEPGEQGTIFDKFERLQSGRHSPGTGLGLFIVKNIVSAHGGSVHVHSVLGGGATFTVWLPGSEPEQRDHESTPAAVALHDAAAVHAA